MTSPRSLRMQNHLRFHGLANDEVARLAGNILATTTQLRMAHCTAYCRQEDSRQVGVGPQTYVGGALVPDYCKYKCLGML